MVLPGLEVAERIDAEDEDEARRRPELVSRGAHRVDRVRRSGTGDLDVPAAETRIVGDSELHHPVAVLGRCDGRRAASMGRRGRRHEAHVGESERLAHLLGRPQVAQVDRVEGAAEDPGPATHEPGRCRSPDTCRW